MKKLFLAVGFQLVCLASSKALIINLNPGPDMDPNALAGFQKAANYWQSVLGDNVEVNIDVDFKALAPNILGQASSSTTGFTVADVRNALIGDATTADDLISIAHLPTLTSGNGLTFVTQANTENGSTVTPLIATTQPTIAFWM